MSAPSSPLSAIKLLAFSIDGTLTDGTTWWGGEAIGWQQRYSARDGDALVRLKRHIHVVPLSRNQTASAREFAARFELDGRWIGVADKLPALREICGRYVVDEASVCIVGDGCEDAGVLRAAGVGYAVADAHPDARAAADTVLGKAGGEHVIEAMEQLLRGAAGP